MIKKLLLTLLLTFNIAYAKMQTMNETQLHEDISKGVVVIDIRRADEWKKYGIIKGSKLITFFDEKGNYDINAWLNEFKKLVKTKDQKFVLICAHANRSKVVGNMLADQLKYTKVYDLKGGINYGWLDKGLKSGQINSK